MKVQPFVPHGWKVRCGISSPFASAVSAPWKCGRRFAADAIGTSVVTNAWPGRCDPSGATAGGSTAVCTSWVLGSASACDCAGWSARGLSHDVHGTAGYVVAWLLALVSPLAACTGCCCCWSMTTSAVALATCVAKLGCAAAAAAVGGSYLAEGWKSGEAVGQVPHLQTHSQSGAMSCLHTGHHGNCGCGRIMFRSRSEACVQATNAAT